MADREYKIRIVTVSEGAGAQESAEGLNAVKKGSEGASEGMKQFNLHGREGHRLIHMLNEIAPGTGLALKAMVNPTNIGIGALLLLLHEGIKLLKEYRKHAAEALEEHAKMATAVWEAQTQAARNAKAAADEWSEKLRITAQEIDRLKQKQEIATAVLDEKTKSNVALAGDDKFRAQEMERRGRAAKLTLLDSQETEQFNARMDAGAEFDAAKAARAAGAPGADKAAEASAWLEAHKEDVGKAQKRLEQAKAGTGMFDVSEESVKNAGIYGGPLAQQFERAKLDKQISDAAKALHDAQAKQEAANEAIEAHRIAAKKLADAEDRAGAKLEGLIKAYQSTEAEIKKLKAVDEAKQAGEDALELQKAGLKTGSVLGRFVLGDIRAEEGRNYGDKLDADQQSGIRQLMSALKAAGVNQAVINEIFKHMMDLHMSHGQKLVEILTALKQLKSQVKSTVIH